MVPPCIYFCVGCFLLASLIVIVSVCSSCWVLTFYSGSIDVPKGVHAFLKDLAQMVFFFLLQLWFRAYCFSSMIQGSSHTVFGGYGMVTVPL